MKYIALAFIVLFLSCNSGKNDPKTLAEAKKEIAFHKFLEKFRMLSLPLILNPDVQLDYTKTESLPDIVTEPGDSLFMDSINLAHEEKAYGMLPDTANCFHLLWLVPVTEWHPCLATFSKTGDLLSLDYIYIGQCGPDECTKCSETTVIRNDYTVYMVDTILTYPCDGPRSDTDKADTSLIYKTGIIPHAGKPVFSGKKVLGK